MKTVCNVMKYSGHLHDNQKAIKGYCSFRPAAIELLKFDYGT